MVHNNIHNVGLFIKIFQNLAYFEIVNAFYYLYSLLIQFG